MATIAFSSTTLPTTLDMRGISVGSWANMTFSGTDVGAAITLAKYSDKSVQVSGTFGAGGSVTIEGSIDGVNYSTLTDPQGNDLNIASASKKIEAISELVLYIRPRITAGDGTTSLTVHIIGKTQE